MKFFYVYIICFLSIFFWGCNVLKNAEANRVNPTITEADPTIFSYHEKYYLYGTSGDKTVNEGIKVYTSEDLRNWEGPAGKQSGFALRKGNTFGSKGFWAPQVFKKRNKFYMAYAANEEIAIASSHSLLGPFVQTFTRPLFNDGFKHIDPFIVKEGVNYYIYFVKLDQGNKIYVAQLSSDFSGVIAGTEKKCIEATDHWENTADSDWPVTEGPAVIKHKGVYYMFYSANDFRNIDYAVGYATSKSLFGPWKKSNQNPIISRKNTGHNGTGHGDIFQSNSGQYYYVLHVHYTNKMVSPRKTAIMPFEFVPTLSGVDSIKIDNQNFSVL